MKFQIRPNKFWPYSPHPKQAKALALFGSGRVNRMLYGGAAGGGKSELAVMLALWGVDYPDWNVLMVAASWDQHKQGGLLRTETYLANEIAAGRVRHNRGDNTFKFASGAQIKFAIMPPDGRMHKKFGSSEYTCICVDEAGELPQEALEYFPERLGRQETGLPTCYLLTSNPIGISFLYLFERYYDAPQAQTSYYLPATIDDNPTIPQSYIDTLEAQPEPRRSQMRYGLWTVTGDGVLWTPELIARARLDDAPALEDMRDICVSVDPSGGISKSGSECGIVVAGRHTGTGEIVVLADWSERLPVTEWPVRIAEVARQHETTRIVFERNFGGMLGPGLLRNAGVGYMYVVSVHTDKGKYERAAPVGILYAANQVRHAPGLDTLERHMASFTPESVKRTDRIDAMVYAVLDVDGGLGKIGSVDERELAAL